MDIFATSPVKKRKFSLTTPNCPPLPVIRASSVPAMGIVRVKSRMSSLSLPNSCGVSKSTTLRISAIADS
ncbi:hypothetical protein D3C81_2334440 [compost metagenome]